MTEMAMRSWCPKCSAMRDVELISICLVKNREDFRTMVVQCEQCGHHRYIGIDQGVDIEIGEKL